MKAAKGLDALTELGARAAALCVAASALCYTAEVAGRYLFGAPLNWSGDVSSYLLCACIFLALPKVTRDGGHVAITFVPERFSERTRARYLRGVQIVAGLVCLLTAGFIAFVGWRHFESGALTSQATQIPRWILAAIAIYGFASSALQLLLARGSVSAQGGAS